MLCLRVHKADGPGAKSMRSDLGCGVTGILRPSLARRQFRRSAERPDALLFHVCSCARSVVRRGAMSVACDCASRQGGDCDAPQSCKGTAPFTAMPGCSACTERSLCSVRARMLARRALCMRVRRWCVRGSVRSSGSRQRPVPRFLAQAIEHGCSDSDSSLSLHQRQ